jgi:hypothetical protein
MHCLVANGILYELVYRCNWAGTRKGGYGVGYSRKKNQFPLKLLL